ncbi:MAG: GrpB family protein [Flavobacteriales bacterium]|nr:GrpB family protein [Flavobacteriales bacterium]
MEGFPIDTARLQALLHEPFEVASYDPQWPALYAGEEQRLQKLLPSALVLRIDHIGSTAVPGLSAKPIIDVQVQVNDLERVREVVVPKLVATGYEHLWRPSIGERAPVYAWFIRRHADGRRTHHVHMLLPDEASADRILFRDHLRTHAEAARAYEALKQELATRFPRDRAAYTSGKSAFVSAILEQARKGR